MEPKILTGDIARFLGITHQAVLKNAKSKNIPYRKTGKNAHFNHTASKQIFNLTFKNKTIAFQIVKGGVGKTALTHAIASKASLYGAKVLCVDLDQQANLTKHFGIKADSLPIVIDVVKNNADIKESIIKITDGIHLLPSRIDNAILDDHIMIESLRLDKVYKDQIDKIQPYYNLILIDCPPALGRSVAAASLASDYIIAPVSPDTQCLTGLDLLSNGLLSLKEKYGKLIPLQVVMNKFDGRTVLSREILSKLIEHKKYRDFLFSTYVRQNQDFANCCATYTSIFDSIKPSGAKEDIDFLTQEILEILPKNTEGKFL